MVSPATFRHPSVLAKMAVSADHVSGGRVELGIGAGWHEGEHRAYGFPFPPTGERMSVFAEQIEIVHGLLSEGTFSFSGEHYALEGVDALPKSVQKPHLPLIVGGNALPRTVALAARFADEYNTVFATPEECVERRAAVAAGWKAEGRDPGTLRFSLMTGCIIGADEAEAAERARLVGERLGEGPGFVSHPAWVTGTLEQAAEHLRALADAGLDRVLLQLLLHDDLDQIR